MGRQEAEAGLGGGGYFVRAGGRAMMDAWHETLTNGKGALVTLPLDQGMVQ